MICKFIVLIQRQNESFNCRISRSVDASVNSFSVVNFFEHFLKLKMSAKPNLKGDYNNVAILFFLYVLQGEI